MTYVQYAEPYPGSRGDLFGATKNRARPHRGQDTAPGGLPILAVADGTFVGTRWSNELGNVASIAHADGKYSNYAHAANLNGVKAGARISRLGSFGLIGATGTAQKGRHLHYTLGNDPWGGISGHVEDPLAWIRAHSNPASVAGTPGNGDLYTAAEHDGLQGPIMWTMAAAYSNKHYGTHLTLDGKDGPNTQIAIARIVAKDLNSKGYKNDAGGVLWSDVELGKSKGKIYWTMVQIHSNLHYGTKLTVDGKPGEWSRKAETKIAAFWLNREDGI